MLAATHGNGGSSGIRGAEVAQKLPKQRHLGSWAVRQRHQMELHIQSCHRSTQKTAIGKKAVRTQEAPARPVKQ